MTALLSGAKPRHPQSDELLFEFLRGHNRFRCELRNHGEWSVEAQFLQNEEFLFSRTFNARMGGEVEDDGGAMDGARRARQ